MNECVGGGIMNKIGHSDEMCRKRIMLLQMFKEDLAESINPLLCEETMDLYADLGNQINVIISEEAKYLSEI